MMKVGVDMVKIDRIDNEEKMANFILSDDEMKIYTNKSNKKEFLAGRFAAKEAFLKANKKGLGEIPFKSIEVLYLDSGAPYIRYGDAHYEVSITHEKEYAMAVVLVDE